MQAIGPQTILLQSLFIYLETIEWVTNMIKYKKQEDEHNHRKWSELVDHTHRYNITQQCYLCYK